MGKVLPLLEVSASLVGWCPELVMRNRLYGRLENKHKHDRKKCWKSVSQLHVLFSVRYC